MKKSKIIHLALIAVGIIFVLLPAFHRGLWFDESYSVAIANKGFGQIWQITGNDVHPALYYWLLHIVNMIFGANIIAYRLLSALAIIILGILGYTHIRKDFGEKTGIAFSFFSYFLPIMNTYAQEIRMYSWSCLLVTLMAIYGYRFYKAVSNNDEKAKLKNLCLFGFFSICSCYVHYYALVTACLINLMLLIYLIKNVKNDKKSLRNFLILAVVQIALYIPWLIYFVGQLKHVGGGFWIKVGLVNTTVEVLGFQFRRQLDTDFTFNMQTITSLIASVLMYIYIGVKMYKMKKEKQDIKPAVLSTIGYVGVIAIIGLASIITPILYSRYLLVMTGLYIFTFSFITSKEKNKIIVGIICGVTLVLAIASNITNMKINYDSSNSELYNYINEEIKPDDIIIYSNIGNGGVVAAYFPDNKQYFLNFAYWDVEEAFKAYGPGMETVTNWDFLKDYKGRIWLIDSEYMGLYNDEFPKENITILKETKRIDTTYHNYIYNVMLVEKN